MPQYNNPSINLMAKRLGLIKEPYPYGGQLGTNPHPEGPKFSDDKLDSSITGVQEQYNRAIFNGGIFQQERMILDKRRSLNKALLYSYQAASVRRVGDEEPLLRALINPNKLKQDYDDKVISIGFESGYKPGDVFEWAGTGTHWLIYLQDLTELAYFRGDIRKCSYQIKYKLDDEVHLTWAAIRGPIETKINYIQKSDISVDKPNFSINFMLPRTKENLEYFRRYAKFYIVGEDEGSQKVCWRVEAIDWISTPGILSINAVEYYINEFEDDYDDNLVGALIVEEANPNTDATEATIEGETFIKPKISYTYKFNGLMVSNWEIDKKYPVIIKQISPYEIEIKWTKATSGQFEIKYGDCVKTIIVESLF